VAAAQGLINSGLIFRLFISSFYYKKAGKIALNLQAYSLGKVKRNRS